MIGFWIYFKIELRRFHSQRISLNKNVKCKMKLLLFIYSVTVNFSKNVFSFLLREKGFLLRKKEKTVKAGKMKF